MWRWQNGERARASRRVGEPGPLAIVPARRSEDAEARAARLRRPARQGAEARAFGIISRRRVPGRHFSQKALQYVRLGRGSGRRSSQQVDPPDWLAL